MIKHLVLVLIFSLVALSGYLFYQNYQLQQKNIVVVPTVTPTPVVDDTKNWKTYTNKELGFSVIIPDNFKIKDSTVGSDWKSVYFEQVGLLIANAPPAIGDPVFKKEIKRQMVVLPDKITLELVLSKRGNTHFEKDGFSNMSEISIIKNVNFTSKFYISAKVLNSESERKFDEIVKILGTFKILDKTGNNVISWKTYNAVNYSFQYPTTWSVKEETLQNLTNVAILDESGFKMMSFNVRPLTVGCPKESSNHKIVNFQIGQKSIGMANFCGLETYFINVVVNNNSPLQLVLDFVGTESEETAREILKTLTIVSIPNNT